MNENKNINMNKDAEGLSFYNKKKFDMEDYKVYIEVFVVLLIITCCILCFLPICNGSFSKYELLISANPDEIDEEEANRIKEEAKREESTIDSLELQREISDVINDFINALKSGNYEVAYSFLDVPSYQSEMTSLKSNVEYNKGYGFFKSYLSSYETSISQVTMLENAATVRIKIKRYDINRLVNKLISQKIKDGENLASATYEELLFEYEKYLKDEFSKSNVYTKESEYIIGVKKIGDTWKIINDDDLDSNIINLEFRLERDITEEDELDETENQIDENIKTN